MTETVETSYNVVLSDSPKSSQSRKCLEHSSYRQFVLRIKALKEMHSFSCLSHPVFGNTSLDFGLWALGRFLIAKSEASPTIKPELDVVEL